MVQIESKNPKSVRVWNKYETSVSDCLWIVCVWCFSAEENCPEKTYEYLPGGDYMDKPLDDDPDRSLDPTEDEGQRGGTLKVSWSWHMMTVDINTGLYTHYVGQIGEKILPQGRHTFRFFEKWLFSFKALKAYFGSLLLPLGCFSENRCRNIKGLYEWQLWFEYIPAADTLLGRDTFLRVRLVLPISPLRMQL